MKTGGHRFFPVKLVSREKNRSYFRRHGYHSNDINSFLPCILLSLERDFYNSVLFAVSTRKNYQKKFTFCPQYSSSQKL